VLGDTKLEEQSVGDELDVLVHQARIHTDQLNWQRFSHKVALDFDGLANDLQNALVCQLVVQMLVKQARKVSVHALISGDQFVTEGQTRHKATFLEPED